MSDSRNEVSHDLLAETLHLRDGVHLDTMCDFNLVFDIFNLVLMFSLSSLQFLYVFNVDVLRVGSHCLLPTGHRIKLLVSVNTLLSSVKELFAKLKLANKHQPRLPNIALGKMLSLCFKPLALFFDKLLSLGLSTMLSELNEVVSQPVSVDGLGS